MILSMSLDWRTHAHDGWQLLLPASVGGGPVERLRNPEISTMSLFRGWIDDDAVFVGVSTRPREFTSLRREAQKVSRGFRDGPNVGELVDVPGARGRARLVDGLMDVEEGYGDPPNWTEHVTCLVVARGRHEVVIVTIRRHPGAQLDATVAQILSSFALTG